MTNKEKYIELCEKEKSICIYNQPWWMDIVCGEDNWDVLLYESNNEIVGYMPYYTKRRIVKYISQPFFTQHNGPWIKPILNERQDNKLSREKKMMTYFAREISKLPIAFYQQSFSPQITNWLPFYWEKYTQTTRYTYCINDISNIDIVYKNFNHSKRQNIKKAQSYSLVVKEDIPSDVFYSLHKCSLEKNKKKINYSYDLFKKIYDNSYNRNQGKTFGVYNNEGKLLCAIFNMSDEISAYNLISANMPEAGEYRALDYAVWYAIQYYSNHGIKKYDFEGSMIEGVEESFRKFGTMQLPYFTIRKVFTHNPIIKFFIRYKLGDN